MQDSLRQAPPLEATTPIPSPEAQKKEKPHGLSATVKEYTDGKTTDTDLQAEMQNRAVEVARSGAKSVREGVSHLFPDTLVPDSKNEDL